MSKRSRRIATGSNPVQQNIIDDLHEFAIETYMSLINKNKDVLNATLEQIVYCVQFGKNPTKAQIFTMLTCKNELQVERKARIIKTN